VYAWLIQEKIGTSVSLLRLWSLEKNVQRNGQDTSRDFWIVKNRELYDKDYSLIVVCVEIQNYDLLCVWLYLRHDSKWQHYIYQASKRWAVDGFPRLVSCSIWMAKPLKSRVRVRVGRLCVPAVYKLTFTAKLSLNGMPKCAEKQSSSIDLYKHALHCSGNIWWKNNFIIVKQR